MNYAIVAKEVFAATREFYKKGFKSANKAYVDGHTDARLGKSGEWLQFFRGDNEKVTAGALPIARGSMLYTLNIPAGNCWELTDVASYLAYKKLHSAKYIWAVSLKPPADHVFCVIGDLKNFWAVDGVKIGDFKKYGRLIDKDAPWVVDAWANVCCPIDEYPEKMSDKMKKWTGDGKRVAWMGKNGKQPGWYAPAGDYAKCFLDAAAIVGASA